MAACLSDLSEDLSDALPSRLNEAVYVIPSKQNKYFEELVSTIPGGLMNISDLADLKLEQSTIDLEMSVWGELFWILGAKQDLPDKDPLVFSLQDFQSSSHVKVTVSGNATKCFPNPDRSQICIFGAKIRPLDTVENGFKTQSDDIPFSLLVDDSIKGCIVLISRWLYSLHTTQSPLEVVESLQFVFLTTTEERLREIEVEELVGKKTSAITQDDPMEDDETPITSDCHVRTASSAEISENANDYEYIELKDLAAGQKANITGVIEQFKEPSHTNKNDYFVSFHITDHSMADSLVNIVAFNSNQDKLPAVNEIGNIILLCRVKVDSFNDTVQVIAPFFSTFHVFRPKSLLPFCSSPNTSLSTNDIEAVRSLNKWYYGYDDNDPMSMEFKYLRNFKSVLPNMKFNIVGMLCGMEILDEDNVLCIALADGTVPSFEFADISYILNSMKYRSLSIPIMVYDSSAILSLLELSRGDSIYLENVQAPVACGETKDGLSMRHSRFCINSGDAGVVFRLPKAYPEARRIKKVLDSQIELPNSPYSPSFVSLARVVTFNVFDDLPFSTIRDIVTNDVVPAKYRLDVKPLKIDVSRVEDVVKLYCEKCLTVYEIPETPDEEENGEFIKPGAQCCSEKCQNDPQNTVSYIYFFKLTIADSSGELQVSVMGDDALMLIPNTTPCNLFMDKLMRDKVLCVFVGLFGRNPFENKSKNARATRMDCGVFTFYPNGVPATLEEKHKATVFYRLFSTILLSKVIK